MCISIYAYICINKFTHGHPITHSSRQWHFRYNGIVVLHELYWNAWRKSEKRIFFQQILQVTPKKTTAVSVDQFVRNWNITILRRLSGKNNSLCKSYGSLMIAQLITRENGIYLSIYIYIYIYIERERDLVKSLIISFFLRKL